MTRTLFLLASLATASAWNVVAHGGSTPRARNVPSEHPSLPKDKLEGVFGLLDVYDQNLAPALADTSMLDNGHSFEVNADESEVFQRRRDEKLARTNPKAWCADRCLATGYCDVLEDFYEMTTSQVQSFCEKCAGSDECELSYA